MPNTTVVEKELAVLRKMLRIHCAGKHGTPQGLCPECDALLAYAAERLHACTFLPEKPVCGQCPVHCYREPQRSRVRAAMKYAGPRMLLKDPVAAIEHLAGRLRRPSPRVLAIRQRQKARAQHDG